MSDTIIQVDSLWKKYRLGEMGTGTLRHDLNRWWHRMRGKPDPYAIVGQEQESEVRSRKLEPTSDLCPLTSEVPLGDDEMWALKGVSFEVKQGEILGIIGRNGAGKSTLLKILSRVTAPTSGEVRAKGRIASLLEVGTGFHPELTGRENIFLNGAILGMRKPEISRKFDEIVGFAEVEKFIDTPVKRYSSGMYVRLAFAVAAHLEPEILIVDEVLAVGDAEFQKKCLGKMGDVASQGRTVLLVSHNMASINRICRRCLLLESGRVSFDDDTHSVTSKYMVSDTGTMGQREWHDERLRPGDDVARLISVRVIQDGQVTDCVDIRYPVDIEMVYENCKAGAQLVSSFALLDLQGVHLFATADFGDNVSGRPRPIGAFRSVCRVPGNLFSEGGVRVVAEVSTRHPVYQIHFLEFDCVGFQVIDTGKPGSVRDGWGRPIPGVMRPKCDWSTTMEQKAPRSEVAKELSSVQ